MKLIVFLYPWCHALLAQLVYGGKWYIEFFKNLMIAYTLEGMALSFYIFISVLFKPID